MKKEYNVSILQLMIKELKKNLKPEQLNEFKNANKDFNLEATEEVFNEMSNAKLESMIVKSIDCLREAWEESLENAEEVKQL